MDPSRRASATRSSRRNARKPLWRSRVSSTTTSGSPESSATSARSQPCSTILDAASALMEEGAALFRELDQPARLATVLANLGHIAGERGDYARAIEVTEEALSLQSSKGNATIATYNLGSYHLLAGDLEQAREWLERAVSAHARARLQGGDGLRARSVRAGSVSSKAIRAAPRTSPESPTASSRTPASSSNPASARPSRRRRRRHARSSATRTTRAHDAAMAAPLEDALRQGARARSRARLALGSGR